MSKDFTIQHLIGSESGLSSITLEDGEIALTKDTGKLYVGNSGNKLQITDMLFYSVSSSFPTTGQINKMYIDTTNKQIYIWSGTKYDSISGSSSSSEIDDNNLTSTTTVLSASKVSGLLNGKVAKPSIAITDENILVSDGLGNFKDSGKKISDLSSGSTASFNDSNLTSSTTGLTSSKINELLNKKINKPNTSITNEHILLSDGADGLKDSGVTIADLAVGSVTLPPVSSLPAENIPLNTTSFNKNLDNTITDVQKLADKLDDLSISASGQANDITLNTSTFNKNLDTTVTDVQKLAEKVDDLTLDETLASKILLNTTNFNKNLDGSVLNVQNLADKVDDLVLTVSGGSITVHIDTIYPTVNDDDTKGYKVGSLFLNQVAGKMYICTSNNTTMAVWKQIDVQIDDSNVSADKVWSSNKTNTELNKKIDKVTGTTNNVMALDGTGNGKDSGVSINALAKQADLTSHMNNTSNPHLTKLSNLNDTVVTTPTDKDIMQYDGTSSKWKNVKTNEFFGQPQFNANKIMGLSVDNSTLGDGKVLKYFSTGNKIVWSEDLTATTVTHKLNATVDPQVTDDASIGYSVGSTWINNTNKTAYMCVSNAIGSAIWKKITLDFTSYDTHIANKNNPHSVTATQVGNTTAQWNANKIQDVNVVVANKADKRALMYNATNNDIEFMDVNAQFPNWIQNHSYKSGDYVIYEHNLYRVKADYVSGLSFDYSKQETLTGMIVVPTENDLPSVANGYVNCMYIVSKDSTRNFSASMYIYKDGGYELMNGGTGSGGGTSSSMGQITKLNLSLGDNGSAISSSNPSTIPINIAYSADFALGSINVLKFIAGSTGVSQVLASFDASESVNYEANDYVEFVNGLLEPRTVYTNDMIDDSVLLDGSGNAVGRVWESVEIDSSLFKSIQSIEII